MYLTKHINQRIQWLMGFVLFSYVGLAGATGTPIRWIVIVKDQGDQSEHILQEIKFIVLIGTKRKRIQSTAS
jgi:hypothetical protein